MGLGLSRAALLILAPPGFVFAAASASAFTDGGAATSSRSRPLRSVLECGRNWSRHGAPLGCRLQLPVSPHLLGPRAAAGNRKASSDNAAPGSSRRLPASVRTCDASSCRRTAFATRVRNVRLPAAVAADIKDARQDDEDRGSSVGIAEGSFMVPLEGIHADTGGSQAATAHGSTSTSLRLHIDIARLQLGAEVVVDTPVRNAAPAADPSTTSAFNVSLSGGALQISMAVPLLGPSPSLGARLRLPGEEAGRPGAPQPRMRVRVEVGAQPRLSPQLGPKTDAADLLVVLEPHLGRWARCHVAENSLDTGKSSSFKSKTVCDKLGESVSSALVLPLAVSATKEPHATLAHRGAGPDRTQPLAGGASWQVPAVSLQWVLTSLVPILAADVAEVTLVVRRSGAVGSAWHVLWEGLQPPERRKLSRLVVDWAPTDGLSCMEAARALFSEGFVRRGPLVCEEDRPVALSFQRGSSLPDRSDMDQAKSAAGASYTIADALEMRSDGRLWTRSLAAVVQNRFPVSHIRTNSVVPEGLSVQLPSFYEVWVEAVSSEVTGCSSMHSRLDDGLHTQAFLLTLEPRLEPWLALLAEADTDLPPGWAHMRHLLVQGSAFATTDPSSRARTEPTASLSWALEVLLGDREVALLVLRDTLFNASPWVATGQHARRFRRVQLESTAAGSGSALDDVSASCTEAKRWAARLGYGLLRGSCALTAASQAGSTLQATTELVFERLG